jgi:hypothetical protein
LGAIGGDTPVSDLDEFLKKTDDEITKAKAAAKAKDDAEQDKRSKVLALVKAEWPTLMPTMRSITAGKKLGNQGFFEYGGNGMMLGGSVVSLVEGRKENERDYHYVAKFRASEFVSQETDVSLTPDLVGDKLQWTANGIKGQLSTEQLANELVIKLVKVYKSTQLPR